MAEREFACDANGLLASQQFVASYCDEPKPAIILDEIVSNIVRCSGASSFSISIERKPDGIELRFVDDGKAFDPTIDAPVPDVMASVQERKIGGLGIFMVRKMSKSLSYERKDGKNVLTLKV